MTHEYVRAGALALLTLIAAACSRPPTAVPSAPAGDVPR
jgi:hypothetical protein